jgi:hypothetical protein
MRKLPLTSIAALLLATGAAHTAEIIVTVMQDTAGKMSIHHQALKDGACVQLVTRFGEQAKNGSPVMLTFESPPQFTGKVVEAYCVMPDGSIGAKFSTPDMPKI